MTKTQCNRSLRPDVPIECASHAQSVSIHDTASARMGLQTWDASQKVSNAVA